MRLRRDLIRSRPFWLMALVCVSASALLAPSSVLASGGWSAPVLIDTPSADTGVELGSVSCASPSFCVAIDDLGNGFSYNGHSWTAIGRIDPAAGNPYRPVSLSCPSASFCMAVDIGGNAIMYDGSTWSAPVKIDSSGWLDSVSCPSASFCAALDSPYTTPGHALTYNGHSWSEPVQIDNAFEQPSSVSCLSTSFCAALDYNPGHAFIYDGSTWSAYAEPASPRRLESMSCASESFCVAVGSAEPLPGEAATYNGSTWTAPVEIDSSAGLWKVSCPSATFCAAVDLRGNVLTYNGSSWSAPVHIAHSTLASVSCPSASFCAAVDDSGEAFTYSPVEQPSPSSTPTLSALSETAKIWREGNALAAISSEQKGKKQSPVGTTFSFSLNEPASVTFTFTGLVSGRKVGKTCVPETKKNNRKRRCTRTVTAGTLTFSAHAGTNKVRFEGPISRHKKLKPGSYTLLATATASGKTSTTRTLHFTIAHG